MSALAALLPLLALDRLPRTGWLLAGIGAPESVAAHSLGTALVALALGPRVRPPLAVERAVALAVVHDVPEALLTDLPRAASELLPSGAKAEAERRAAERLLGPFGPEALALQREFAAGETREARFARLCDKLHLGLRWLGYLREGARGLEEFRPGLVALECGEFAPCAELRDELVSAAERLRRSDA
jgi:putative hydrolase of HD superfamily